jgi:copper chaperone CopZ
VNLSEELGAGLKINGESIMVCECVHKEFMEVEWSVPTIETKECAEKVGLAIEEIADVRGVRVNLLLKTVTVCFDDSRIGLQQLKDVMSRAGFPAVLV